MKNAATTQTCELPNEQITYPDVILHYVRKSNIAESAVLGTNMYALCGFVWSAKDTNYGATANPRQSKAPICPMCADIYYSLYGEGSSW